MKRVRKAVVPVAGYGTRFLPETKAVPKEMLPIIDKPVIHYIVEELVESGIEQIIFVTSWHKRSIEDYFDRHLELESRLKETGKDEYFEKIRRVADMAQFVTVRQKEQRGTADAILTAKDIVGNEPFLVTWGDEIVTADPPKSKQLIDAFEKYDGIVLGVIKADKPEDADKYGYAAGEKIGDGITLVSELIEKPGKGKAPSSLATIGGSIYPPQIFEAFQQLEATPGKEMIYIDGINILRDHGVKTYSVEIKNGKHYDCGNVLEYLKTNVEMALQRDDIKEEFGSFIKEAAGKLPRQ